jgi:hypothetical protein
MFFSKSGFALMCTNSDNGSVLFAETLTSAAVPVSEPDGTLVWRSTLKLLNISCIEDWPDKYSKEQSVYAYFNPNNAAVGDGVNIGININGTDFPDIKSVGSKWLLPGVTVPACKSKPCNAVNFSLSYYVTIRKSGNKSSGNYSGSDTIDFFQLDGSGGMNSTPNSNYRYRLSGLQNIRFLSCSASLNVIPSVIDFGLVVIPTSPTADSMIKTKEFSINVSRSCTDPFKLTAVYTTSGTPDNDKVKFNDMYLKLFDATRNKYVSFNGSLEDLIDFADLTDNLQITLPYKAELYWQGTKPTAGEYSTTVTVSVFYN